MPLRPQTLRAKRALSVLHVTTTGTMGGMSCWVILGDAEIPHSPLTPTCRQEKSCPHWWVKLEVQSSQVVSIHTLGGKKGACEHMEGNKFSQLSIQPSSTSPDRCVGILPYSLWKMEL